MFDRETGLYDLRARKYDAESGRFVTQDTFLGRTDDPFSKNLYLYANSNPILFADPSGNSVVKSAQAFAAGVRTAFNVGANVAPIVSLIGATATGLDVALRAGTGTVTHGFIATQFYAGLQYRYAGAGVDRVDAAVFPRGATLEFSVVQPLPADSVRQIDSVSIPGSFSSTSFGGAIQFNNEFAPRVQFESSLDLIGGVAGNVNSGADFDAINQSASLAIGFFVTSYGVDNSSGDGAYYWGVGSAADTDLDDALGGAPIRFSVTWGYDFPDDGIQTIFDIATGNFG